MIQLAKFNPNSLLKKTAPLIEKFLESTEAQEKLAEILTSLDATLDKISTQIKKLNATKKAVESAKQHLRDLLAAKIASIGQDPRGGWPVFHTSLASISIRTCPPQPTIDDISQLPEEFLTATITMPATIWRSLEPIATKLNTTQEPITVTIQPNLKKLHQHLTSGASVQGARLQTGELTLVLRRSNLDHPQD